MKWIKFSDEMPPNNTRVLVYAKAPMGEWMAMATDRKHLDIIGAGIFDPSFGFYSTHFKPPGNIELTHWALLEDSDLPDLSS